MSGISKLGKYLIRREIGKGAMGVVYEGFDPAIERKVAIKTILPQQLSGPEAGEVLARFKREAQAAGRLNHPGIVAVYDYGEVVAEDDRTMLAAPGALQATAPQVVFIAMEYVEGRELKDCFDSNQRFPITEVARIMGEILDALSHAHSHGVVHRDIKPANLILLDNGSVKIADFGIARVEKSELTQVGTVMGTPSYMSPEQFMGNSVDGRSDLFSCGVILYQFLTGEKPFTGSTTTIMYKVLREDPLEPSLLNAALPKAFDAVLKKAVAKDPAERYQSAEEFSAAIQAAAVNPVQARPGSADDETVIRPQTAVPPKPEKSTKPANRVALRTAGLAVAGLLLAIGLGWWFLSGTSEPDATPAPIAMPAPDPLPVSSAPAQPPEPPASAIAFAASTPLPVSAPVPTAVPTPVTKPAQPAVNPSAPTPSPTVAKPPPKAAPEPSPSVDLKPANAVTVEAEADPKKTCDGRVLLGYLFCMTEQCAKPTLHDHPTCREWRAMEKSRREAREAGQ